VPERDHVGIAETPDPLLATGIRTPDGPSNRDAKPTVSTPRPARAWTERLVTVTVTVTVVGPGGATRTSA